MVVRDRLRGSRARAADAGRQCQSSVDSRHYGCVQFLVLMDISPLRFFCLFFGRVWGLQDVPVVDPVRTGRGWKMRIHGYSCMYTIYDLTYAVYDRDFDFLKKKLTSQLRALLYMYLCTRTS